MEEEFLFYPEKGNVAFSSAYDCWSFTLPSFISNVAKALGMNRKALLKFMWGQYYYNVKEKNVSKVPEHEKTEEMFVQYIMNPLVEKYHKVFKPEIMNNTSLVAEAHVKIKARMNKIVPMEDGVLRMVVDNLPSPEESQKYKLKMLCPLLLQPNITAEMKKIRESINECKKQFKD